MLLMVAASPVQALVEDLNPNYAVSVDPVSRFTVPAGKWYVLYNVGRKVYLYENGAHRSTLLVDCSSVHESAPYLFRFVDAGESKYYIQTSEGKYFKDLVTWNTAPGVTTNLSEAGKFTLEEINGNAGHWCIRGSSYIMDSNGTNMVAYGTNATLNGNSDWSIFEARILNPDELTGSTLTSFQLARGGLCRIHSRGNSSQYINEVVNTRKASTRTKSTAENLRLAQMWIIEHNEDGFSLRNAQTGDYMQDNYTCSTNKYFWKIQLSPNNSSDEDPYIIICHGEVGSYKRNCANLNGGSSGLTDWYYDNDRNSEWVLQPVESSEVDTATVKANLSSICNAGQLDLEAGAYYRFTNIDNNLVMGERKGDNRIVTGEPSDEAWEQYWKVVKNDEEDTYTLQNVFSGRYLNRKASSPSSAAGGYYSTTNNSGTTTLNWIIKESNYAWISSYNIIEPLKPETGLATKDNQGVNADINSTAAQWILNRVDLTEEQLQKAADAYEEYNLIYNTSPSVLNSRLEKYFSNYAFTELKDEFKEMSDEDLTADMKETGLPKMLIDMTLKIKNDTWGHREKEFRIYDYEAYSDPTKWNATNLVATSYQFSPQTSPTGISVKAGDVVLIFANENAPTYATLTFSSNKDYDINPSVTQLKRGVNVFVPANDGHLFIHYTITNTSKKLADFQPITIHIEGGRVQGYFDITRGHTNADWKDMVENLFQDRIVHLKNKYYQFNMDYKELLKQITDKELDEIDTDGIAKGIEGTLHRWDQIVALDRYLIGAEQFADRFNCMLSASSSSDGNPYATTYGTYYPGVGTIMNYDAMTHGKENDNGANYWCIAHETGHVHQNLINLAGCTELCVNFFSHACTWMQGSNTGRYGPWKEQRDYFYKNTFWNDYGEDVGLKSRMYFQLYLYFHVMEHDVTFYPRLFDMFRNSPLVQSTDATRPGSGTTDYLKFAKFCCDVAQADLSEYFQFWGFFVPVKNYEFGDYSNKYMTTTQAEIDAAIAYMQKYPKKLGNILFIDERIKKYPADYPGMPEGATRLATTSSATPGDASEVGQTGMFTDFVDGAPYRKYTCTYRAKTKEMLISGGQGAVGFKFYNADHKMIYADNNFTIKMPDDLINAEYYIVAALGDGSDLIIYDPRNLTAVNDATTAEDANATFDPTKPTYDLSGRSVNEPQRGNIYLQNGIKVRY